MAPTEAAAEALARPNYAQWYANLTKLWRDFGAVPVRFARDFDEARQRGIAIAGTPARVREEIERQVAESGCTYFVCRLMFGGMTDAAATAAIDLFSGGGDARPDRALAAHYLIRSSGGDTVNGKRTVAIALALSTCLLGAGLFPGRSAAQAKPEGEMRWALYVTLSPVWFDPGEVIGVLTPFWILYALHDALVKPMPGNHLTPSLAESWTVSADQKAYEFKLRQGLKFHNGDPFTAEDVKFSFLRAKGAKILQRQGPGGRGRRSAPRALRAARAVARLHDLLRHVRDRRRLDRAQEVPWSRWAPTASRSIRSGSAPTSSSATRLASSS